VSSAGESHPHALAEPYVNVSAHTAPAVEPRRTPICPWANNPGSRREIRAIQGVALRTGPRRFLDFREAQRARERARGRILGDRAARSYRPYSWSQPRICGVNIRDRSASDLARRRGSCPCRLSARIAWPALSATAGLQCMQSGPCPCFDCRGRNVSPRKSHGACGSVPRRSASWPSTIVVFSGGSSRRHACPRAAMAPRPSWASAAVRPCPSASSADLANGRRGEVVRLHTSQAECSNSCASRGRMPPPCGGPCARAVTPPSSSGAGTGTHRAMESTTHGSVACVFTARLSRAWARLSKQPLRSRSTTPSKAPHRCRACPTASRADFPGRYPSASGGKRGSTAGSSLVCTTLGAIRSETVGLPSVRSPPCACGSFTVRPGGGQERPADIRCQLLEGVACSLCATSAIVGASTPAAPGVALPCFSASQTSPWAIPYGFAARLGSSPGWLAPGMRRHTTTPSLHPCGGDCVAPTRGSAPGHRFRTLALRGLPRALLRAPRCARFPRAVPPPLTGSGHRHAGCRSVRQQVAPERIPRARLPAVVTSSLRFRPVLRGSLAVLFLPDTCPGSPQAFSSCAHDQGFGPQPPEGVWHLLLPAGSEGPPLSGGTVAHSGGSFSRLRARGARSSAYLIQYVRWVNFLPFTVWVPGPPACFTTSSRP